MENLVKSSYTQSYPLYPHEKDVDEEIYIRIQETNVLVKNHKIAYSDKKSGISIDILNVKILENISPKRINLVFENKIIR